jgi:hypothetical protein
MRTYKPTGRPRGRPKKISPASLPNSTPPILTPLSTPASINENQSSSIVAMKNPPITQQIPQKSDLPVSAPVSTDELKSAIMQRDKTLDKLLCSILPNAELRERERYKEALIMTSEGVKWTRIARKTGLRWIEISCMNRCKGWIELWHIARDAGEDYRMELRLSVAHDRAVNGWREPVFYKGAGCGLIKKFDNRLLEFMLKADNPGKFREQSAQVNIQNNVVSTVVKMYRKRPAPDAEIEENRVTTPPPHETPINIEENDKNE